MASVDGSKSLLATSDEVQYCGSCKYRGIKKDAKSYCNECQECLCDPCADSHKGMKLSRNHEVLPLSRALIMSQTCFVSSLILCDCSKHNGVSVYCKDHNDVICQTSEIVKHRKCETTPLTEQGASRYHTSIQTIVKKMTKVNDGFDNTLKQITSILGDLCASKRESQADIKNFRKELNTFFDTLEATALKEADTLEELEKETIKRHQSSCLATKQLLENDQKLVGQVVKGNESADVFAAEVKLSANLKEYKIVLHDICQETKPPSITFERNKQLQEAIQKILNLGKVTVECQNQLQGLNLASD